MADMEKLLDGLHCRATNFPEKDCAHCHYGIQMGRRWGCDFMRMCGDAIALLKAQEPKQAKIEGNDMINIGFCPNCGKLLQPWGAKYCYDCGQAVKWE